MGCFLRIRNAASAETNTTKPAKKSWYEARKIKGQIVSLDLVSLIVPGPFRNRIARGCRPASP